MGMQKILCLLSCFFLLNAGRAQSPVQKNPLVERMTGEVSKDSLQSYIRTLVAFGTRHTLSNQTDPHRGIGAARSWVLDKFREFAAAGGGRMTAKIDTWTQPADGGSINRPVVMGNVIATLKGTDPADDRIFIVSGHLDSRCSDILDSTDTAPGADDDGSGVAAVLEMARIMSRERFSATILFVAVSGEEQGLLGSDHLAEEAKKGNWNVAAMLNNDIIGGSRAGSSETHLMDNTRVRVFSEGIPFVETPQMTARRKAMGGENDSRSRELARYIKETGKRYVDNLDVTLIYRDDRFLRSGDHIPFSKRGFTAVRLTDYYENYYHQHQDVRMEKGIQYGDLEKFVDFDYLRKNTCLNLATLACLANAPAGPEEVKLDVSKLGNYTRIFWKAPRYGKPGGYYVLMRETDQPDWQQKFYTTATELTLPYSKDNYFFAVEAVGEEGLESVPVFP